MAKPKAPEWLTTGFKDGVDERESMFAFEEGSYGCWLAQFDTEKRPCTDKLERCHIIGRQRVEHALGALMPTDWDAVEDVIRYKVAESYADLVSPAFYDPARWAPELVLLAAWDPRNARIACEGHHRRFDSHLTPPLVVPYDALPEHVFEFAEDYGLELQLEERCPKRKASA